MPAASLMEDAPAVDPALTLSSTELVRLSSCSYRQIDYWTRERVLLPSVPAHGSGSRRVYPIRELGVLLTIDEMEQALGCPLSMVTLRRVAAAVRPISDLAWLRIDGDVVERVAEPKLDGAWYWHVIA